MSGDPTTNPSRKIVFVCEKHPEYGSNGWRQKNRPGFAPYGGMATAHDCLEHFPVPKVEIDTDEFQALGAALYVRGDGGYWRNRAGGYPDQSPGENIASDLPEIVRTYENQPVPEAARARKCEPYVEEWIDEAIREGKKLCIEEYFEYEIEKDPSFKKRIKDLLECARGWFRVGYRRAVKRYSVVHGGASAVCHMFKQIEQGADAALRDAEIGDELVVTVDATHQRVFVRHVPAYELYADEYPEENPPAEVVTVFNALIASAPPGSFPAPVALVVDEETALAGRPAHGRAQAASDEGTVYIAPKLVDASGPRGRERQVGVLAHELAHVHLLQLGCVDHTEREADEFAKRLFGMTIRYDDEDVQTIDPGGVSPRPAHLDSRGSGRKSTRSNPTQSIDELMAQIEPDTRPTREEVEAFVAYVEGAIASAPAPVTRLMECEWDFGPITLMLGAGVVEVYRSKSERARTRSPATSVDEPIYISHGPEQYVEGVGKNYPRDPLYKHPEWMKEMAASGAWAYPRDSRGEMSKIPTQRKPWQYIGAPHPGWARLGPRAMGYWLSEDWRETLGLSPEQPRIRKTIAGPKLRNPREGRS